MSRAVIKGDRFEMVYDDRWMPIVKALGRPEIERASDVEWDHETEQWVARYRPTGEVIARGPNRAEVIQAEVAWIEGQLNKEGGEEQ